jgi:hypothetical protein
MKHQLKKALVKFAAVLCFMFFVTSCGDAESSSATPTCTINCSNEIGIDLLQNVLEPYTAIAERMFFDTCVSTSAGQVDTFVVTLTNESLCDLKQHTDELYPTSSCQSNFITAVRMFYGMNTGKSKIELIYQPLLLCLDSSWQTTNGTSTCTHVRLSINEQGLFYKIQNEAFIPVESETVQIDTARYMNNIKIKRAGGTIGAFEPGVDVSSAIFSFQEIKQLMDQNASSNGISIWNSMKTVTINNESIRRHGIFMGPSELGSINQKSFLEPNFASKYANFAHFCPDDCIKFDFIKSCETTSKLK